MDVAISVAEIVRVSVSSDGNEVTDHSPMRPNNLPMDISADGNRIVYLKPPIGLYLYDVPQDISVPLSVTLEGEVVSAYSAAISSSGNAVVLESPHPGLVENDTNDTYDIFVAKLNSP